MKKIFGGLNLNYKIIILSAIVIGIYTGVVAMIPALQDTSFTDMTATFEVWILFGIIIIANSKSPSDSALKSFLFFLISQPIVYLVQDVVNHSSLFMLYYRNWVPWTIACLPMGYIGYFMKKDRWWGLLILTPMLIFLGSHFGEYLSKMLFSFPRHLLTAIFCAVTLAIYPMFIFKNKKIKTTGIIISSIIILTMIIVNIIEPPIYSTDLMTNGETYHFDDTYRAYLSGKEYGDLTIKYEPALEDWILHADFKKAGKTELVLLSSDGTIEKYNITIRRDSFDIEIKN